MGVLVEDVPGAKGGGGWAGCCAPGCTLRPRPPPVCCLRRDDDLAGSGEGWLEDDPDVVLKAWVVRGGRNGEETPPRTKVE